MGLQKYSKRKKINCQICFSSIGSLLTNDFLPYVPVVNDEEAVCLYKNTLQVSHSVSPPQELSRNLVWSATPLPHRGLNWANISWYMCNYMLKFVQMVWSSLCKTVRGWWKRESIIKQRSVCGCVCSDCGVCVQMCVKR